MNIGETIKINGIDYVIMRARPYKHNGHDRTEYTLRRPRGRVPYYMVRYENGMLSDVVSGF
jgi:hypothetical protein